MLFDKQYRSGDEAELHLRMGFLLEGVLVGLEDEATIDGCVVPRCCRQYKIRDHFFVAK